MIQNFMFRPRSGGRESKYPFYCRPSSIHLLYRNDYVLPPPPPPPLLYLTTKASIDFKPTNLDPPGM